MLPDGQYKSVCGICVANCGVEVIIQGGRVVKVQGDPAHPQNRGALCKRAEPIVENLYHPDRLQHPLKRAGKRGEGKWDVISWEEAFDITAQALGSAKEQYGPESVLMAHGGAKGYRDTLVVRFANAFGTPNEVCAAYICHNPRQIAAEMTFGYLPRADYGHPPGSMIIWGVNTANTKFFIYKQWLQAVARGTKLIVIDPVEVDIAQRAALWLRPRPGSDMALALAMIYVVIQEGLYDRAFVRDWTVGFEDLKTHIQAYAPEKMAEVTWVDAETIRKAARLYAQNSPGVIEWGNAIDHTSNSFQASRAVAILMALSGSLEAPGGQLPPPVLKVRNRWDPVLELRHLIPEKKRQTKLGADLLRNPDFRYTIPQAVLRSIHEGKPYRLHAAYVQGTNPILTWPNARKTFDAFKKLDFFAVSEFYMTPTAALADIVFPSATWLEHDGISASGAFHRKVAQIGEARSVYEIIQGIASRLGLGSHFWDTADGWWNAILEPSGITFEEFKESGLPPNQGGQQYRRYEEKGFLTPSKKVEFFSDRLKRWGTDPLPLYREPPETPLSAPDLVQEYPLVCTTGKAAEYHHSGGRHLSSVRNAYPDPVMMIHPDTAAQYRIRDGMWAWIETKRGRIRQKAKLTAAVDPRVVYIDHAWWFPEKGAEEVYGWADSNGNILTDDESAPCPEIGS